MKHHIFSSNVRFFFDVRGLSPETTKPKYQDTFGAWLFQSHHALACLQFPLGDSRTDDDPLPNAGQICKLIGHAASFSVNMSDLYFPFFPKQDSCLVEPWMEFQVVSWQCIISTSTFASISTSTLRYPRDQASSKPK